MIKKSDGYLVEFGLVLLFMSTQIANVYRLYVGEFSDIASYIIVFGLICMLNTKTSFHINKYQGILILYQGCILIFAYMNGETLMQPSTGLIYILFIIVFTLISTTVTTIDGNKFVFLAWLLTGVLNVVLALYFIRENLDGFNSYYSSDGTLIADRSTLAALSYFHVLAMLTYSTKRKIMRGIKIVLLIAALYNIATTMRRGMFITLVLILILHVYLTVGHQPKVKTIFLGVTIIAVIYLLYRKVPYFYIQANRMLNSSLNAISVLLGKDSTYEDLAAISRVQSRKIVLNEMKAFTYQDWLFGRGYNARWIDFPFLQCFYDMGIIGGTIYVIMQLVPFRFFFMRRRKMKNYEKLFFYLFLISFVNNFYSGIPYGIAKFMYIIPLLAEWKDVKDWLQ